MWSIVNLVFFLAVLIVSPEYYLLSFETFLYSFVFLCVGFVFFLLNIMGGGDSKFLFTFFLIVPLGLQEQTFEYLLVSTILVGTFVFITNISKNFDKLKYALKVKDKQAIRSCFGTKFAFAPIILITWIWVGWKIKDTF